MTQAQALKRLANEVRLFKRKVGASSALVVSRGTGGTLFQVGRGFPRPLIPLAVGSNPEHSPSIIFRASSPHVFVASLSEFVVLALALRSTRQEPRAWLGFRHRKALLAGLAETLVSPSVPDPPTPKAHVGFGTVAVLSFPRAVGKPA